MNTNLEKDYKKWILFNNQLSDYQNLYELYTSVELRKGKGGVTVEVIDDLERSCLLIEQAGYEVSLEIEGDTERKRFLEYLVQHYFPNEEIDEWYQSKVAEKEKKENLLGSSNFEEKSASKIDFKVHPKENQYFKLRVFFSGCFYVILIGIVINAFLISTISGVMTILPILGFVLFFWLAGRIAHGFFIGLIKGSSVKLNEHQYPEVYKIVKDQSLQMQLPETPEVYVLHGYFNAFVTKFARKKFLVLHSEVIETALRGDFDVLKFIVGHELGHIERRHLSLEKWLIPSSFVPFLKQAHSRGCEYTCDRIGYHFSVKGAMEGILILATGKEIYSKINMKKYIDDSNSEGSFWVWISEKFLTHPYTFKRLTALRDYAERGY